MSKKKSLAETHPELVKQWHSTKNGDLTPGDVTKGSGKIVWWKCDKGDDHEWKTSVVKRTYGRKCPVCSGQKVVKSNSLAALNPEISKQWHPTKNGDLTPFDLTRNSGKKVWWKCDRGDDHIWESAVCSRTSGRGCPICSGRKIVKSNCLTTTHPNIAKEWHPTKNGDLTPYDVSKGSHKKVWWKCDKGDDHVWEAMVSSRNAGSKCPVCFGQKIVKSNCLATTHPNIAKEWHPTKNGDLTPNDVSKGSNKKVWWKCKKGDDHEWRSTIADRSIKSCPICSNKKIVKSNCLATTHPNIAKEWHPTKNGDLTPYDVSKGSHKKVWWKCDKGDDHEWRVDVRSRLNMSKCPICCNQKVVKSNCLATTHPNIAKEWHPTKNGDLTPYDVVAGSSKKVWWNCEKGEDHEWKSQISNVTRDLSNCPFCTLTPQSKQELIIMFELSKLFKNIEPKGFKTRLDGRLRAIDIFIPNLNLCIEFDGHYWHKNKRDLDKIKSEMLFEKGFKLIRVREEPLTKIYETDVISKKPYNGKLVTNDILSTILSMFDLDSKMVSKIKDYQIRNDLQNEKGLNKYIDKILTDKSKSF